MRIGFGLPHTGPAASPDAIVQVAKRAEAMGFHSLWVYERFLFPTDPQVPYAGTADGSYPEAFKTALDPLDSLTLAATQTRTITLGTSVLDMPYYNPVLLARRITTLDHISGGRVRIGLGLGWSKDEFDAVGREMRGLGRYADEFIAVLKAIWTSDPVEFHGKHFNLPRSIIQPKPVQKPHPPIYLGAFSEGALQRAATVASGWNPVFLPIDVMRQMHEGFQQMARAAGRDPASLELVVRANLHQTSEPLGEGRPAYYGTLDQIREDVRATEAMGAAEIFFDPTFSPAGETLEGYFATMDAVRDMV
jgi:probable F420-dependent oxidoreductase